MPLSNATRLQGLLGASLLASAFLASSAMAQVPATRPHVMPEPQAMTLTGDTLTAGASARLVVRGKVDEETLTLVRRGLATIGITNVRETSRFAIGSKETQVVVGLEDDRQVSQALAAAGGSKAGKSEGYALASAQERENIALIVLDGHDADGLYYAAQTFAQLAARGSIPTLSITDYPKMAVRGSIEGFYGAPWTLNDRLAHLAFLGSLKANTYIYSPKDDPYARDKWRETYPAATFADLELLIETARKNHVRFTYAISPGLSVCYSDPDDAEVLERKFDRFRKAGVRSFYIAYDDIAYDKWNCEADKAAFGEPGHAAAGTAQAQFTNTIYNWLHDRLGDDAELMIVPTEYYDAKESPYKTALQAVDPRVFVQWTGTDVVPPSIGVRDAKAATKAFGRKTLLWDNYPVNDYGESTGRLLMAPYRGREAGLDEELSGILANPMNQEAPSRVAVTGSAAFSWNDHDYDPDATSLFAARKLGGTDADAVNALLMFFDLENLAPTFGSQPWQPQAPALARELGWIRDALSNGTPEVRKTALRRLSDVADRIAGASDIIRAKVEDKGFLQQTAPWLDAMALWGQSLQATAQGLSAAMTQDPTATIRFAQAKGLADDAAAIETIPGTTRPQGKIRVGDGVLDRFIADAPGMVYVSPVNAPRTTQGED